MDEDAGGALDDLRVLEVGSETSAWCGKLLADMGAVVLKVEPPGGDVTRTYGPFYRDQPGPNNSLHFWHYNTNKKSVTLNISVPSGQHLFRRLVNTTDIIIDGSPPGHLDSLGLGYSAINRINPRLILAAITPFGQQGPLHDFAATDLTVLAFGGPAWSCGYDDHSLPPVRGGGNQGYHTACHWAVIGIMIAVLHRNRTGLGQFIDVNMHAASNVTTEGATYGWLVARNIVQRQTGRHASVRRTAPTQVRCRDGRYVNAGIGASSEEQWISLVAWLNEEGIVEDVGEYLALPSREALARGDPEAMRQQERVNQAIQALALTKDAYELFREAQERGLQWGIVYSPDEVIEDPHINARGFPVDVEHPELGATFRYPGAPYRFAASPWAVRRRAPLVGEDNHAVYIGELGLRPEDLVALTEAKVI